MITSNSFANLRYSKRVHDPLLILNKGIKSKGFMVCKDCSTAIPSDAPLPLEKEGIFKPYKHPHKDHRCRHLETVNTYLGNQFLTDMMF